MKSILLSSTFVLTLACVPLAVAQEEEDNSTDIAPETSAPVSEDIDVDALMARVRARLERINEATQERDQALNFLENQIEAATDRITGTGETNVSLRSRTAALNTEVEDLSRDRERLSDVVSERDELLQRLEQQVASLELELGNRSSALEDVQQSADMLRSELEQERSTNQALEGSLASLRSDRQELVSRIEQETARTSSLEEELGNLRNVNTKLNDELTAQDQAFSAEETQFETRLASLNNELSARDAELEKLNAVNASTRQELEASNARVRILSSHLLELTEQLGAVENLLANSELRVSEQQDQILRLGERLNLAMAKQVEELSRYRSEFFGRLQEVLGEDSAFRVVGDRFVFPSEVLFASGSDEIGPEGETQLRQLAETLNSVAAKIPPEIEWILRVDGHTDRVPIATWEFSSNWELSTARAISVVETLIELGVSADRLAATGFGEFQPLSRGESPEALRRNRRIEFKLTSS